MSRRYRIAVYLRLSKEDEDIMDESCSIANQRMMLEAYVRENFEDYELKEFSDDGFSGTNFRRPEAADMLEQLRCGEIDCVVVKDFSRFSRDYIELGSYLEQIFPFLGVRFISLNDNYDSAVHNGNTAGLETSFKGLMYDLYSKDLSVKVKSSLRARKGQGQYASAHTPFGYAKAPEDRHRLILAEDEAEVVRKIFSLALEGNTSTQIAKQLNQENVRTPIEFKIEKGQTRRKPSGSRFQWSSTAICSILKNPVYTGDMAYGKYGRDGVGGKNHLKPRSEWNVCQNHHAAVVSRDDFDKIQKLRSHAGSGKAKNGVCRHPLQGKVYCGGCGRAMTLRKSSRNPYFYCKQKYVSADAQNCGGSIRLMLLEQAVLDRINAQRPGQENMERMQQQKEIELHEKINSLKKERDILYRRKAALQRKRLEEYEKSVFHKDCRFQADDAAARKSEKKLETKHDNVCCELALLENELNVLKEKKHNCAESFSDEPGRRLTAELAEAFIRTITVYNEADIKIDIK